MTEKTFEDAEAVLEDLVHGTRKSGSSEMEVVHQHLEDLLCNARHDRESYKETLDLVKCSLEEIIEAAGVITRKLEYLMREAQ
jgi:hypothetical protein